MPISGGSQTGVLCNGNNGLALEPQGFCPIALLWVLARDSTQHPCLPQRLLAPLDLLGQMDLVTGSSKDSLDAQQSPVLISEVYLALIMCNV